MSWSVSCQGTREKVKEEVSAQYDKLAEQYAGKPEGDDIVAAKERTLKLIDAMDLTKDSYGSDWNAVNVTASGSHGWNEKGLTNAGFSVNVIRTHLAL